MTYEATYAKHYATGPQLTDPGADTWLTRGANFVVALSRVKAGARLARVANPDEYIVFLPGGAAEIEAGKEKIEAAAESLTIVPPGASAVTSRGSGLVVRVFSSNARDLLDLAGNASTYKAGAPGAAPLKPWPDPLGGYRLRNYRVADFSKPDSQFRIFRSTNLMVNVLTARTVPRDVRKLSPHSHTDFEQASLAIQGTYIHHLRWPWTPDMTTWRDDQHVEMGSPSVLVVPPTVVHSSANIDAPGRLIDIFSPPRLDFSARPGMVCNADEYPVPPDADLSAYTSSGAA
jgi:mannose-6-phosphate isomerase-like protein (cupin superfamily)